MMGSSWITNTPSYPSCVVLVDPHTDRKCGAPAKGGRTILDCAICDECHDAVSR